MKGTVAPDSASCMTDVAEGRGIAGWRDANQRRNGVGVAILGNVTMHPQRGTLQPLRARAREARAPCAWQPGIDIDSIPHEEIVTFVRHRRLYGRGVGWIDIHLLASAMVGRFAMWTADPRFSAVADELGANDAPRSS